MTFSPVSEMSFTHFDFSQVWWHCYEDTMVSWFFASERFFYQLKYFNVRADEKKYVHNCFVFSGVV